jgi:hypothetical protein
VDATLRNQRSCEAFQCLLCGEVRPFRTFEACEIDTSRASAMSRTGSPWTFGKMSRLKPTPSSDPSSRPRRDGLALS